MGEQKERMLRGDWYRADAPDLVAERRRCQAMLERFNAAGVAEEERAALPGDLLDAIGAWLGGGVIVCAGVSVARTP